MYSLGVNDMWYALDLIAPLIVDCFTIHYKLGCVDAVATSYVFW